MRKKRKRVYKKTKCYVYSIDGLATWEHKPFNYIATTRSKKQAMDMTEIYISQLYNCTPVEVLILQIEKIATKYI